MIVSCRPALPKDKSASRPVGPTNGSGFGEKILKAGIAQLTERRSRKAEAGGLIPAASTMPAYLNRQSTFDSMLRAPIIDAPFAKRQRHLAYNQTFGGSSPSGSTTVVGL